MEPAFKKKTESKGAVGIKRFEYIHFNRATIIPLFDENVTHTIKSCLSSKHDFTANRRIYSTSLLCLCWGASLEQVYVFQQTLYTIMLRVGAPAHHSGIVPIDYFFSMDIPQPNYISRHSICMP